MERGFIYIVEYLGIDETIKGLKYAGSKLYSKGWKTYLGSPSAKNNEQVRVWNILKKTTPADFKRTIIRDIVLSEESIVEAEITLLNSLSDDIQSDTAFQDLEDFQNIHLQKSL